MKATTTIGFSRPEHNHVPASPGKARSTLHEAIKNTPAGILSDGRTYQHILSRSSLTASLHGLNQTLEIFRIYVADVPDAESVGLGNLARIYHEAFRFQLGIEVMTGDCTAAGNNALKPSDSMPFTNTSWFLQ